MSTRPTTAREGKLLEAARNGHHDAFGRLVEPTARSSTRGPARDRFAADVLRRFGLPDRLATSAGESGPSRTE